MNYSTLLKHPYVLAGIGAGLLIALMSAGYYWSATREPAVPQSLLGAVPGDIVAQGSVSAAENPELAFAQGGRVSGVYVRAGDRVSAGEVLATTDTGVLAANVAGAQAKLSEMENGAVATDIQSAQTGVAQAQSALDSLYRGLPAQILDAQAKAQAAVFVTIAPLVARQGPQGQQFTFVSGNPDDDIRVGREYDDVEAVLDAWSGAQASLDAAPDSAKEAALADTLDKLRQVRALLSDLLALLPQSDTSTISGGTSVETARTDIITANASVSASITTLTTAQSSLASAKLGIASAQTGLDKTVAGTRPEDIAAQRAVVAAAAAALRQAEIIAPFAGTVGSVSVKQGDIVAADTQAVSLLPEGAAQVDIYVSELDMTKLSVGQAAEVVLDAYGASRPFSGTVAAIDQAPSPSGYRVVVSLPQDASIAIGMHATVTIHAPANQH